MAKAYIIDGNSLLFRAYYATAYGPNPSIMRNKEGTPTNAIFAFGNMLLKILTNVKEGDILFVGFDTDKPTFRHEENKEYKANRKACPEDLKIQMPLVRELLKSLNIFIYEKQGYEADDICGTFAKKAAKEGYNVLIYTSDKDYLQLIDKNINISLLKTGMSNMVLMTEEAMMEMYGYTPIQIIDYKGLRGDASDNLPGIPGIGEKGATKLIQEYGSLESIIEHADDIGGKVGQSIKDNKEQGLLCKRLATILLDVELPFEVDDAVYEGYEFDKINKFCNYYELRQFLNRIPNKLQKSENIETEIEVQEVATFKGIELPESIGIALDIEPGNYYNAQVYGIAISTKHNHYYIDIEDAKNDETLKEILANPNIKKSCFNYKAIKVALSKLNLKIAGLRFDALLAIYILDTSLVGDIDSTMRYFGINISSNKEDALSLFEVKDPTRTAKIAYGTLKVSDKAIKEIEQLRCLELFTEVDMPLSDVLADIEIEGFPMDKGVLNEFGKEFKAKADEYKKIIYQLAGEEFNIDSPKQVGEVLFTKLCLEPQNKRMSTSIEVLNELVDKHPIIPALIEYRKYTKLLNTYVTGLISTLHSDGKIHAQFNQALTSTGRLSSSEPNLQNIATRDEERKTVKKAFYYDDPNIWILSLDYSQIELRILASLSDCKALQDVFASNEDIHASTASKVFHVDKPTYEQRRKAKAVNFGIIYGISDWGLAEQIGVTPTEAKNIINSFYEAYPEIGEYFQGISSGVMEDGYVTTLLGRRRYLREVHDANYQVREAARRAAMNAPIQGSAADLIKIAMVKVGQALKEKGLKSKMVLQIHDELLFAVPSEEKDITLSLVKEIMENALNLKVNLAVEGGYGRTWYDCK